MRKLLRLIGGGLAFVALAVLTLNVEAVAVVLGLNNVAMHPSVLGTIVAVLTSPLTLYIALICLGFGIFVLIDRLARRWDASHPSQDERLRSMWVDLDDLSEAVGNQLQGGQPIPSMALAAKVAAKYRTLNRLGLATPLLLPDSRYWFSTNKLFLDQIVPILREGHIGDAKLLAEQFVKNVNEAPPEGRAQIEQQLDQQFGGMI